MTKGNQKVKDDKKVPVPAQQASGAVAVPSFMANQRGQGMEGLGSGDYEIPRIKLLQALSPELEAHDDAKAGVFWHTLSEDNLGPKLRFVPVFISKRFVLWNPRESGGGILARSDDGIRWTPDHGTFEVKLKGGKQVKWSLAPTVAGSGLDQWGSSDPDDPNSQPAATQVYMIAAALLDHPQYSPSVIMLQRSNIKPARNMLGKLKLTNAPTYGCVFEAEAVKEKGSQGDYYNWRFTASGFVQSEEDFKSYQKLYEMFSSMGLNVKDLESAQDEGSETNGPTGGEAGKNDKY